MELNKSENHIEESTQSPLVLQYDDQFPPLPISNTPKIVQNSKPRIIQTKSSVVTQTLVVPLAERRFSNRDANNSIKNDAQKKICQNVAQKCGVTIELNSGKDQNLSVFINGPQDNVLNAKRILAKELQTQTQLQIKVPKEYHKFILGRNGASLKEIECNSNTNITIPRSLENNDVVTIYGTKEGIDKARNEINLIVSERSKLATERITIPKRFYPFINGANNMVITKIREMTNVKINIPPANVDSEDIIISGDKEGVYQALNAIQKIYDDTKKCSSSLNLPIPKSQHCYVIGAKGSGIAEIFERTGVSIEMPSQDSDDDTIVLYGPNEALAPALSMVIQKSESMIRVNIEAPNWLHRFIIGKQGSNLNKLLEKYERVFINFQDNSDSIIIEGPKEDVTELKSQISEKIAELKSTMAISEIQVDPRFHRHIIGRSGANILRMQEEHKVQIRMPGNNAIGTSGWIIRIEGDPEGVKLAKSEIESMSVKLENEKTKDVILDHKYHNQLIGAQGNRVKELRNQYPDVIIMFPDLASKSDIVQLRGPRQQVDQVAIKLNKFIQEVIENNYTKDVKIFKQYHKNIIGKGGANIRKIREETNIRIDFPDEHSDSDKIRLTGKKENVEEAAKRIETMQADLISIKEDSISIPHRLHISLIGTRGKLIKCIQQDCGGVQIQFPSSDSTSDVIKIRGPEADVDKAKKQLLELSEKNLLVSHQDSVVAKSDFHKFLIGRKGVHLAEFRKRHAVLLIFPDSEDTNKDVIQIIGAKEIVQKAKEELEETIKSLENEIEKLITIDTKWHKHFFKKRQAVMEEISREFGGVRIFFPKQDAVDNIDQVRVIGPKGCVEAAIVRIEDIIENLEAQTNISVFIEQKHHRNLITRNMTEIKNIQNSFDVMIKFPNRDLSARSGGGAENGYYEEMVPHMNGNTNNSGNTDNTNSSGNTDNTNSSGNTENTNNTDNTDNNTCEQEVTDGNENAETELNNPANWVTLSGRRENCESAKEALLELVPVTEDVPLSNEFHRNFIGQKGQGINTFSTKYNVVVNIPPANKCFDFISIKGPRANLIDAKAGLDELIVGWENEKQDRIARNYENQVDVPIVFHRKLIGQRGANIEMFRNKFNVSIQIPDQNSKSEEIIIRGYEEDVKRAEDELLSMVEKWKAQVIEELHIPRDVHPQLIGSRGSALRKLREQFNVEINFPHKNAGDDSANRVEVIGDKENVDKCCDILVERANELLYEWEERNQVREVKNSIKDRDNINSNNLKEKGPGFLLAGAPWQRVPDASSNVDFPTIDANGDKIAGTCLLNGHSE